MPTAEQWPAIFEHTAAVVAARNAKKWALVKVRGERSLAALKRHEAKHPRRKLEEWELNM